MDRQTALSIIRMVRDEKQALDPASAIQGVATQGIKSDALRDVGNVALMTLGIGAGARGAVGLYNVLKRNLAKPPKPTQHLAVVPTPVPEEKLAGVLDFFSGDQAVTKEGIPWYKPAMILGGLGALYGGWKGVDALLKKKQEADVDEDVESARAQFNQALLGNYQRSVPGLKAAADTGELEKLGADLDRLAEAFEKAAGMFDAVMPSPETAGKAFNAYSVYAVPTALIAGYAAYKAGQKRQRAEVLKEAIKQRAMRRQAQQPAELFAVPMRHGDTVEKLDAAEKFDMQ